MQSDFELILFGGISGARSGFGQKAFFNQNFDVALKAAPVDGGAEGFEILDGHFIVHEQEFEGFALAFVQSVFVQEHVSPDD